MTNSYSERSGGQAGPPLKGVRLVKPLQFDGNTPQTRGMQRLAAVSRALVGSESLWAGVMMAEPNTVSNVHHHGPLETVVYVAEGRSKLRWGRRLEHETEMEPGDFLFLPPFLPHQEINPSPDQPVMWIVVRNAPEPVIVELTPGAGGEYVAPDAAEANRRPSGANEQGPNRVSRIWLAASVLAALGVAVVDGLWVKSAARGWQVFLQAAIITVLAVFGATWSRCTRAARHFAALDAFAVREMARERHAPGRRGMAPQGWDVVARDPGSE